MGSINLSAKHLIETVADISAIKSGIILSNSELITLISERLEDTEIFKEENLDKFIRIRSEVLEDIIYYIRDKLGELKENENDFVFKKRVSIFNKWAGSNHDFNLIFRKIIDIMKDYKSKFPDTKIDPVFLMHKLIEETKIPQELAFDIIDILVDHQTITNHVFDFERKDWDGGTSLKLLFSGENIPQNPQNYIDQKFINYLETNKDKVDIIHWRNFERLTAEFFMREGYEVELGPGQNDGGVDLRLWRKNNNKEEPALILVQCKRHKLSNKVDINTVKAFYTDVEFENAEKGIIATTSAIEAGGKKIASARKYPLSFAENSEINNWVQKMRTSKIINK